MNLKQALEVLSDFLIHCEDEGVALPDDPLNAVAAAIRALDQEVKHEMGRPQMEAALAHMRREFGVMKKPVNTAAAKSGSKRRGSQDIIMKDNEQASPSGGSPTSQQPSAQHRQRSTGHSKLQDEVVSQPAKKSENQSLVDQLVQLGEYELLSGHTQRGIARLRAAKEIRDANEVITSGAQARKLDRVGASAAGKIDLILNEGLEGALREYEGE